MIVRMAKAGSLPTNQGLTCLGRVEIDLGDLKVLSRPPDNGRFGFHFELLVDEVKATPFGDYVFFHAKFLFLSPLCVLCALCGETRL
jgi:hypothetical protein